MRGRGRTATIVVEEHHKRAILRGWKMGELAREAGAWPVFSGVTGGWSIDLSKLPDVVALAEYRNIRLTITEAGPGGPEAA